MIRVGVIEGRFFANEITTRCFNFPTSFFTIDPTIHSPISIGIATDLSVSQQITSFSANHLSNANWESQGWDISENIDSQLIQFVQSNLLSTLGNDITILKCHLADHILAIAYSSNITNYKGFVLDESGYGILMEDGSNILME